MNNIIDDLNECIHSTGLNTFSKVIIDSESNELFINLVNTSGGEYENKYLEIRFIDCIIFHLPRFLSSTISFKIEDSSLAKKYIPNISYDKEEFSDQGYKVFALCEDNNPTGYYVAAMNIKFSLGSL